MTNIDELIARLRTYSGKVMHGPAMMGRYGKDNPLSTWGSPPHWGDGNTPCNVEIEAPMTTDTSQPHDVSLVERCPICGCNALAMTDGEGWAVYCNNDGTWGNDAPEACYTRGPRRDTEADAIAAWNHRAALQSSPLQEALDWATVDTAPVAVTVLAARFDESFGEWIYGVVKSPPSHPFTHWRMLPDPPALNHSRGKG